MSFDRMSLSQLLKYGKLFRPEKLFIQVTAKDAPISRLLRVAIFKISHIIRLESA